MTRTLIVLLLAASLGTALALALIVAPQVAAPPEMPSALRVFGSLVIALSAFALMALVEVLRNRAAALVDRIRTR